MLCELKFEYWFLVKSYFVFGVDIEGFFSFSGYFDFSGRKDEMLLVECSQ